MASDSYNTPSCVHRVMYYSYSDDVIKALTCCMYSSPH